MPGILQHPSTNIIRQLRAKHPIIIPFVVGLWPPQHLIPRHRELRTTRHAYHLRHIGIIEQLLPRLRIDLLRGLARTLTEWVDFIRTPGRLLAAEVDIAVSLDGVDLQVADGVDVAVGEGVGVPGLGPAVFVAVDEDHGGGEVVVVFDDVLEIGEAFFAFVDGGVAGGIDVVDGVDVISPAGSVSIILFKILEVTHLASSSPTHDVSSYDILAMTITRSFGMVIGVVL